MRRSDSSSCSRRVVFVLPALPENPATGGEIFNRRLVLGLRERGVTVDVVTLADLREAPAGERLRECWKRITAAAQGDPVVIDTWLYRWLWPLVAALRLRTGSPVITFSQLCYWDTRRSATSRVLHRVMTWLTLLPARTRIGVSATTLSDDCAPLPGRRAVIYPGSEFHPNLPEVRKRTPRLRLISVANYAPRKGFHVLLEALAILSRRAPELAERIQLRLVGNLKFDAAYVSALEELVNVNGLHDRVIMDGWKTREEVSALLAESDAFLFASQSEGFGMVTVEALVHGLPAVLAPYRAAREVLGPEGRAGFIARERSAEAFAEEMQRFAQMNDAELARLSAGALARSREVSPGWNETIDRFGEVVFA